MYPGAAPSFYSKRDARIPDASLPHEDHHAASFSPQGGAAEDLVGVAPSPSPPQLVGSTSPRFANNDEVKLPGDIREYFLLDARGPCFRKPEGADVPEGHTTVLQPHCNVDVVFSSIEFPAAARKVTHAAVQNVGRQIRLRRTSPPLDP